MGHNLAVMWPGNTGRPWQGLPAGRSIRPKIEDVQLLDERLQGHWGVSGEIHNWGVTMTQGDRTVTGMVIGASEQYGRLRKQIPEMGGRYLNALDHEMRRRVVFLGDELAKELFGDEDPVGGTVTLDGMPYTVIGTMVPKVMMGNYGGMDEDHAIVPISTYKSQWGRETLSVLVVRPNDPNRMEHLLQQVHEVLGAKLGFDPEDERVLGTWNTIESSKVTVNMSIGIQMFLGVIGGLTLIVGGIGVANIMYAVVKERTREIGVKMAVGARRGWITWPIVLEGLAYTLLGGTIGLLMAVGVVAALGAMPTDDSALRMLGKPTLSIQIGLGTAAILGTIGLLAGYFPARRAASIDPAETLRYE
jgi:putative ABC transport system permease protein